MTLALLLIGTFAFAFNVGLVRAQAKTIYINSDGSVTPFSAPISPSTTSLTSSLEIFSINQSLYREITLCLMDSGTPFKEAGARV
jgi:hypothetical protein